jgi:hypothetical protein
MIQLRKCKQESSQKTKKNVLDRLESWQQDLLSPLFAVVLFVFRLDHFHQKVFILDGNR